jgi:phage gpG-like protein
MLQVEVQDDVSAALAAMPDRVRQALSSKANMLAVALQAKIQQKLSGTVLNARSGALARSIVAIVDDTGADIAVRIGSTGDIKYAAIHEFGGTIPPHEIVPNKAKALAFAIGGKQVFAKRVNLPAVTLPGRSYLRSSLAEMTGEIIGEFSQAVGEAALQAME